MAKETISNFINTKYKDFALYTLHNRAIPSIKDGLKPVQRRILYISKDEAKEFKKVSNIAGACLKIHPHGDVAISSAIGGMTQDFCGANNIPYFIGKGAFGGKIVGPGKGIGASRYVSVKLSNFSKEVIFKDYELVNIIPSYDGEYNECDNFLPLIPISLINGISGIAVGFATEILPYKLNDIVEIQKQVLSGKIEENNKLKPYYKGFNGKIYFDPVMNKYKTEGVIAKEKDFIRVTELPIGTNREQFIKILNNLIDKEKIRDYKDDSKGDFNFRIFLKKQKDLKYISILEFINLFKLTSYLNENLTLLDTTNKLKIYKNPIEIIKEFTLWRFSFYKKKYEKLLKEKQEELSYNEELLKFIEYVIKNDYIRKMTKLKRNEIISELKTTFPSIEKMLTYSISSFSFDNILLLKDKIKDNINIIKEYGEIVKSETKQKNIYIQELEQVNREF